MEEYNNMTVTRLRALAKEHELKGYSKKRKAELITFIRENLRVFCHRRGWSKKPTHHTPPPSATPPPKEPLQCAHQSSYDLPT